jgi:hypothetical protein
MMGFSKLRFMTYCPIGLTFALIVWTAIVSPYSKDGDNWAVIPALSVFPIATAVHILLIAIKKGSKIKLIGYAVIHMGLLFFITLRCLMIISKDSL